MEGILIKREHHTSHHQDHNIELLAETLSIASQGRYFAGGKEVPLTYDPVRLSEATVITPAQAQKNRERIKEMITLPANAAPGPFTV